ncbi:MAG TPA: matrixin family metalloprotease [Gaiellaceae bacterium]|jgi:hypothetical protein
MRRFPLPLAALIGALSLAVSAGPALAAAPPTSGFLVFKDTGRGVASLEIRDNATGRVVMREHVSLKRHPHKHHGHRHPQGHPFDPKAACNDESFVTYASWPSRPSYWINLEGVPRNLNKILVWAELVSSQKAWEHHFRSNCKRPHGHNGYDAKSKGLTNRQPTLVTDLVDDGKNVVGFASLAGTVCDGAVACTVADFDETGIHEADMAFEPDLTRYGFQDFWTTKPRTWFNSTGGEYAVLDVATHEFGHFAGLDHVFESPELTMYPIIHDGDDTLGRGDMLGLLSLY